MRRPRDPRAFSDPNRLSVSLISASVGGPSRLEQKLEGLGEAETRPSAGRRPARALHISVS